MTLFYFPNLGNAEKAPTKSAFVNPEWKNNFKRNYKELIEDKLSRSAKDAIEANEDIQVFVVFNLRES